MIGSLLTLTLLGAPPGGPGPEIVPLAHKRHRDWSIQLPAETFTPVRDGIRLGEGRFFAAALDGTGLRLDLDGDGAMDVTLEGEGGSVLLRGADGFRYAARLVQGVDGWAFAAGGAMTGTAEGVKVAVIDQDNDGVYGEVGEDAVLVGRGTTATWLGRTLSVGGRLHTVRVAEDGSELSLEPYAGETGRLGVVQGFEGEGRILSAVVRSLDGEHCLDLAAYDEAVEVPAGRYRLLSGSIGLSTMAVAVGPGGSPAVEVAAGGDAVLAWGGPVRAEFAFQRSGDQLAFSPDHVWYFGANGEEYTKWWPVGKSPVFTVTDETTEQEVARAMFPGSC